MSRLLRRERPPGGRHLEGDRRAVHPYARMRTAALDPAWANPYAPGPGRSRWPGPGWAVVPAVLPETVATDRAEHRLFSLP